MRENDTLSRNRQGGLASRGGTESAKHCRRCPRGLAGLAADQGQTHGGLTLAAKARQAGVGQQV
ncbi:MULTISPECIES: hypothetical protein [Pseudomonas]|uniref:Uncharacterized protein n=1 Tax=Pseudomonas promysalinigenes TaxID=485898 RepID=A0ABY6AIC0_9PSED|nr:MULTISPECIES: hypothetical protein [Pseudomonas]UXH39396.1 hypothetical protein N5C08_20910 [Pseudomonas promysalinigenes]